VIGCWPSCGDVRFELARPAIPDISRFPPTIDAVPPDLKRSPAGLTDMSIFKLSFIKITNRRMGRGANPAKKEARRSATEAVRKFFDREFDWIALLVITVIILLSLVFF